MISAAAGCVDAAGFCLFTPYTVVWKTKSITWKTVAPAGGMEMGALNNADAAVAPDALSVSDWGSHSDNYRHPPQRQYVCIPSAMLQQHLWWEEWEAEAKVCLCNSQLAVCKFVSGDCEKASWSSLCSAYVCEVVIKVETKWKEKRNLPSSLLPKSGSFFLRICSSSQVVDLCEGLPWPCLQPGFSTLLQHRYVGNESTQHWSGWSTHFLERFVCAVILTYVGFHYHGTASFFRKHPESAANLALEVLKAQFWTAVQCRKEYLRKVALRK